MEVRNLSEWTALGVVGSILAYLLTRAKSTLERDEARTRQLEQGLAQRQAFEDTLRAQVLELVNDLEATRAELRTCENKHKETEVEITRLRREQVRLRKKLGLDGDYEDGG